MVLCADPAGAVSDGWGPGWETDNDKSLWAVSVNVISRSTPDGTGAPLFPPAAYIRTFGVSENATDGFDRYLDIPAPPLPMEEALDVYFPCSHEVVTRLANDIRPDSGSITWDLKLTVPTGSTASVSWDVKDVPSGYTLTMTCGNKDVDMKEQSSVSLGSGVYSLSITANKPVRGKTSGSSGGSSGGGGGGSPEPQSNVETKELAQQFVANGNNVEFEFKQGVTCIVYVEFEARKSFGKVTTVVEMLKGKSILTPIEPEGKVYKYLNIWVGNGGVATPENIENPVIGFKVEKAWLEKNAIPESSIRLWRYGDEMWAPLSTKKVSEDEGYIYFEAETPGFSPFAITGLTEEYFEMQASTSGSVNSKAPSADENVGSKYAEEPEKEATPGLGMISALGFFACACLMCRRF